MTAERHDSLKERITRVMDVLEGKRRVDRIDEFFADDYVRWATDGAYSRSEFRAVLEDLHRGFPDLEFELVDMVAEGDRVAYRWEAVGAHLGAYMGVPPTGKRVVARGITISRFDTDGRIVEDWASWNKASVLHSLGMIPIS